MLKHYNIRVYGKVVDVDFRHSARRLAEELGITGFARNERDGTLYIEAEGSDRALRQFVEWCQTGPKYAKVERVEVSEGGISGFQDFKRV